MALRERQKQTKAIELVAQAYSNLKPSNLHIMQRKSVFDGTIFVISWHSEAENRDNESTVFFRADDSHFFSAPLDLVKFLDETQPKHIVYEKPAGKRAETFQKFTAGIQSIAVIIIALIGGWWALRTYVFEHPRFYEEGWEVAGVPITGTIEAEQISALPKSRLVSVRVTLSHKSHLTQIIILSENPVLTSLVNGKGDYGPRTTKVYAVIIDKDGKQIFRQSVDVPPGEQALLAFAFSPPEPGLYLIQFDPCATGRLGRPCVIQKYVSVR